jgi:hypothetical protein
MTSGIVMSSPLRRAAIAALALATAAACVIGATDAAKAASTRRQQHGFGAAARVAAGQAAATLAPDESMLTAGHATTHSQVLRRSRRVTVPERWLRRGARGVHDAARTRRR